MSRKKVKKEVVKRKTNIYDPMGVYGRGLTENQRLGMTRQMKIENIRNPGKSITGNDLKEYRKIIEFYGMYKPIPTGNIKSFAISYPFNATHTLTNQFILDWLHDMQHIDNPVFFACDTFVITRPDDVTWATDLSYWIVVGNSGARVIASPYQATISKSDPRVTIPRYFMTGTQLNYFRLCYDDDQSDMFIKQGFWDISNEPQMSDFLTLPNDGTPMPYLLYPNTIFPELKVRVGFDYLPGVLYEIIFNVIVIY